MQKHFHCWQYNKYKSHCCSRVYRSHQSKIYRAGITHKLEQYHVLVSLSCQIIVLFLLACVGPRPPPSRFMPTSFCLVQLAALARLSRRRLRQTSLVGRHSHMNLKLSLFFGIVTCDSMTRNKEIVRIERKTYRRDGNNQWFATLSRPSCI